MPDGTDISAIELTFPDGHWRVCVRTLTPGHVIGRRGATADAVRAAIAEQLGDPRLRLDIVDGAFTCRPKPKRRVSARSARKDRRPGRPSARTAKW